jgi:hypothetical protein
MPTSAQWSETVRRLVTDLHQTQCQLIRALEERELFEQRYQELQTVCAEQRILLHRTDEQIQDCLQVLDSAERLAAMTIPLEPGETRTARVQATTTGTVS